MNFETFGFYPQIAAGITAAGYHHPTPIQTKAIPQIMKGLDLIGLAQTGTGKTAAFVLPILHRLLKDKPRHLRALIVAPTRELAEQINQSCKMLGIQTGLRSAVIYGGVGIHPQIQALKKGDIVVACPGRLLDHIGRKTIDLSNIDILVLDEADQMFDMGFLPDIRKILSYLKKSNRQTLLFSATMPVQIRSLADDILMKNKVKIEENDNAPADTVSHTFYPVARHLKTALVVELLKTTPIKSVLIFTRTKHWARRLGGKLTQAGYRATSLQGNLSQSRRRDAMDGFKSGKYQVLVATDIAARGIDVSDVSHVINFDMPSTSETYIHRIGRTGRIKQTGEAYTLITSEDTQMVKAIERTIGTSVDQCTIADFNYHSPKAADIRSTNSRQRKPKKNRNKTTNRQSGKKGVKGAFSWFLHTKTETSNNTDGPMRRRP